MEHIRPLDPVNLPQRNISRRRFLRDASVSSTLALLLQDTRTILAEDALSDEPRFCPLPPEITKRTVYSKHNTEQESNIERLWIGIHHQHGSPASLLRERRTLHLKHQRDVFADLQALLSHYGSDNIFFFLEGFKGPMTQWNNEQFAACDRALQKQRRLQDSGSDVLEEMGAELSERLEKCNKEKGEDWESDGWKIFHEYDPRFAFAGHCKSQGLTSIIYGCEPSWWDPKRQILKPVPEELSPLDRIDFMIEELDRATKQLPEDHRKRNEYAAAIMERTVPRGKVGVINIGALHFGIIPRTKIYKGIPGLEELFLKIPASQAIIIQTTSFKELQQTEKM